MDVSIGVVIDPRRTKVLSFAGAFFAIAVGLWYFLGGNTGISDLLSGHYPIRKQVRITLLLSNQTGRDLTSAEVRLYGVVAQTPDQKVLRTTIDSPYLQFNDDYRNTAWVFQFGDLAHTATKRINSTIDIGFSDQVGHPQEDDAERFRYVNTAFVENPEIRGLVKELSQDSPAESLERLLAWFREQHVNLESQDISKNSDVLSALSKPYDPSSNEPPVITDPVKSVFEVFQSSERTAVGNAVLFSALARAIGLPSRVVTGLQIVADQTLTFNDVMVWTEVKVDSRWLHVDIDSGVLIADQPSHYLAMRILDPGMEDIRPKPYDYLIETVGVQVSPGSVKMWLTKSE